MRCKTHRKKCCGLWSVCTTWVPVNRLLILEVDVYKLEILHERRKMHLAVHGASKIAFAQTTMPRSLGSLAAAQELRVTRDSSFVEQQPWGCVVLPSPTKTEPRRARPTVSREITIDVWNMHHANLPIEIIIKRYLWLRAWGAEHPDAPLHRRLDVVDVPKPAAAAARFAPSAYNIRCAKIGKSTVEGR